MYPPAQKSEIQWVVSNTKIVIGPGGLRAADGSEAGHCFHLLFFSSFSSTSSAFHWLWGYPGSSSFVFISQILRNIYNEFIKSEKICIQHLGLHFIICIIIVNLTKGQIMIWSKPSKLANQVLTCEIINYEIIIDLNWLIKSIDL